jgi:hypothetical protein
MLKRWLLFSWPAKALAAVGCAINRAQVDLIFGPSWPLD